MERTRRIWVGWAMSSALLIACGTTHGDASTRKLEMRLVSESGVGAERVPSWSGDPLPLEREVLVSGRDVESVELVADPGAETHSLSMQLTSDAGQRFEDMTAHNVGRRLAVVVGDRIAMAPVIKAKIVGGKLAITGHTDSEIRQMHRLLGG